MRKLKIHPLAERLPEMTPEEFAAFKLGVATLGKFTDKIVVLDGKILDGRHRQRAGAELGIEPQYEELTGEQFRRRYGDPAEFVIAKASHRNLTSAQKACIAESFMEDFVAARGDEIKGRSDEYAAERFGVASKYVKIVRQIRAKSPELYDELRSGRLNVNQANNRFRQLGRRSHVRKLAKIDAPASGDWKIILGDAIEQLQVMPAKSARVIFADPPYNIGLKYHGDKSGDSMGRAEFIDWCSSWLNECARVLSDDGSIFVMIPANYAHTLAVIMGSMECGLQYRDTIAWVERFGPHRESSLTPCWRPILYFTKSDSFIWNEVREPSDRQEKYGDKRANPAGKTLTNVWEVARLQGTTNERVPYDDAPPQLPIAVPERAILLASNPGDLVVDPFNGNGTTGVAAVVNGRRYIGIERSKRYRNQAEQWMAGEIARRLKANGGK